VPDYFAHCAVKNVIHRSRSVRVGTLGAGGIRLRRESLPLNMSTSWLNEFAKLPFEPFAFHGHEGKRRCISYGWHYDFNSSQFHEAAPFPAFLTTVRDRRAEFAGLAPSDLRHALLLEYPPDAGIGWHKDKPTLVRWWRLSPFCLRLALSAKARRPVEARLDCRGAEICLFAAWSFANGVGNTVSLQSNTNATPSLFVHCEARVSLTIFDHARNCRSSIRAFLIAYPSRSLLK
jgi:hypothetical protein